MINKGEIYQPLPDTSLTDKYKIWVDAPCWLDEMNDDQRAQYHQATFTVPPTVISPDGYIAQLDNRNLCLYPHLQSGNVRVESHTLDGKNSTTVEIDSQTGHIISAEMIYRPFMEADAEYPQTHTIVDFKKGRAYKYEEIVESQIENPVFPDLKANGIINWATHIKRDIEPIFDRCFIQF